MLWRFLGSKRLKRALPAMAVLAVMAGMIQYPSECSAAAQEGLELCANVLLPSLFPFFVLSALVVELGLAQQLGRLLSPVMVPLFRVSGEGAVAVMLGAIGGYPVGARTAIALYKEGRCTKLQTQRLLAFCNNSGPAFILGVVGAGIFESGAMGVLLYFCHISASLLVGLLFRFYGKEEPTPSASPRPDPPAKPFSAAFTSSITSSFHSVLNICAFVLFFTVLARLATLFPLLDPLSTLLAPRLAPLLSRLSAGVSPGFTPLRSLLLGGLELTSGVTSLTAGTLAGRASLAAFMLGWAGLCVHFQVLSFLADTGLSPRTYLAGKFLHGLISALFVYILTHFLPLDQPAFLPLTPLFSDSLALSTSLALWLFIFFFFFAFWGRKKGENVVK